MPLLLNGVAFGSIRVGVSTIFLRSELTPRLRHAIGLSAIAILCSLILAALLSRVALGPLEHINRSLDNMTDGRELKPPEGEHDEYGLVSQKIANLGRQMRDTREIFSALKNNVDQIMSSLQDGLMLFTRDSRVVLVSAAVERFLGRSRGELLGRSVREIFSTDSARRFSPASQCGARRVGNAERAPRPGVTGFYPREGNADWRAAHDARCGVCETD
jgi:signal transduction histidine kinase